MIKCFILIIKQLTLPVDNMKRVNTLIKWLGLKYLEGFKKCSGSFKKAEKTVLPKTAAALKT